MPLRSSQAPCLLSSIKFYWSTPTLIGLCIVCGCFCASRAAELHRQCTASPRAVTHSQVPVESLAKYNTQTLFWPLHQCHAPYQVVGLSKSLGRKQRWQRQLKTGVRMPGTKAAGKQNPSWGHCVTAVETDSGQHFLCCPVPDISDSPTLYCCGLNRVIYFQKIIQDALIGPQQNKLWSKSELRKKKP